MTNPPAAPAPRRRLPRLLLVVAAYLALITGFTWPLPVQLADHLVLARGVDLWQHVWNFGWVRLALIDLHQSPYYTHSIYYPAGVPLVYHALNLFSATVSIPLQLVFGLVPAFNLLLLGNLLAAALATYWLARVLGLPVAPAFLAGLLFACSPPIGASFNNGQGELVSVFWMPLCLGLLLRGAGLRALGLPPGGRRYLVGAGLALAGAVLAIYYWFVSLLVFLAVYSLLEFSIFDFRFSIGRRLVPHSKIADPPTKIENRKSKIENRRWLGRMVLVGGVALLAISPLLLLFVRALGSGGADLSLSRSSTSDAVVFLSSQDLLSFFLPLPSHIDPAALTWHGPNLGLGWTVLALAGVAGLRARGPRRRGLMVWGVAAAVFGVLALGPTLQVAGQTPGVPLPYAAILDLPGAAAMRVPLRFLTPLALCMAILAAYGFSIFDFRFSIGEAEGPGAQQSKIENRKSKIRMAAVLALVVVEFFNVPRPSSVPDVPPFFRELAARPSPCNGAVPAAPVGCGAVLELPHDAWVAPAMFHQAISGHPIIGGYTSRHYPDPFAVEAPGVSQLVFADPTALGPDILTPPLSTTAGQAMDYYGVRYVVVHPLIDYPAAANLRRVLAALFPGGGTPSGDVTVYSVPGVPQDRAFLYLGAGWYDQERTPAGVRYRWSDRQATLHLVVPPPAAGAYTLVLAVYSVAGPRTLVAALDGREVARGPVTLPPGATVRVPLALAPGEHLLTLASVEPAVAPPGDRRTLSLGYRAVTLTRGP